MNKLQLRVLYRQFLFRVFDVEMLSAHAQGDANKLLGQFAALLVFISVSLSLPAMALSDPAASSAGSRNVGLVFTMVAQHFLIATTMLVVGLFAVLSWDATFPDRRDVLVLAPLPVRARTMFLAKVAAVATALGLTIGLLHSALGLICPLVFAERTVPARLPALTLDATPVPVAAHDLQTVMDRDLRQALTTGDLAPRRGAGLAIGVSKHGERRVFTYGAAKPESLFEIGSISKTFTGLILARMAAEGKVRLDEPVRELLPAGTVAKPAGSADKDQEITLLDLATHHSGLPPMPSNFHPADRSNPYADYGPEQLYAYLARHGAAKPEDAPFEYSNLGVGLLGQALAERAGTSYADQLREEITDPLGMADTVVKLSPEQQERFLQGYDAHHRPVHAWDLDALAGAGAIRSTAGDMMTYLEANLHPEKYGLLAGALASSHLIREGAGGGAQIALGWLYYADSGSYQHGGATAGFTSYVFFNPPADCAAVVLMNSGPNTLLSPDLIGEHIRQRLSGEPAISLDTVLVPASGGFLGLVRSFGAYWFTMLAAGVFVYGAVLGMQGLAALLFPRRLFLRLSGYLQLAAICVIVGVYFLQPGFGGLDELTIGSIGRVIQWLPSYCFLALYQQLNGSMHPALEPMARRAWTGLAAVVCGTAVAYTLSYWRTLRKIVEEPDLVPGPPRLGWLPRFGNQAQTAIGQFSVRTLARSRQHRLILGFYLGIGLAFTSLLLKGSGAAVNNPRREESMLLWAASIMMMVLAAVGTRVAFAMPLDLRANWIFRIVGVRAGSESLAANRRALLLLSVAPVWLATAAACLGLWPGRQNVGHLMALGLLGLTVADICLLRFRKIPFTCSWLPGKSRINMAFLGAIGLLWGGTAAAMLERHALRETGSMAVMLGLLVLAWVCVRWTTMTLARGEEQELRFEEEAAPVVQGLGLYRDGVMLVAPLQATQKP
ncbi:MAG: beta-lactamase family protein [Acidobacteriota bacterium]|nr:beta-lactamase family protein [Acidobacteriota bacterium]